jgi:hypothetical protein
MMKIRFYILDALLVVAGMFFMTGTPMSHALIDGCRSTNFALVAKQDHIVTSDGDSMLMWGYALENGCPGENPVKHPVGRMIYPGPTMILNEGDVVTVTLKNALPVQAGNVSIVFPGHKVSATGGVPGLLTREAPPDGTTAVTYVFTATEPGTYLYRSGTRPDLQVEMGLVGAIIVRPSLGAQYAYNHADTEFGHEYLYLITEMDPRIHRQVEMGQWSSIDTTSYFATNWFVNGRNFPDLMADSYVPWLPTQPYNCQPRMHVGDKTLIRLIGGGRDLHPMHLHGNDFETIAVDGRLLSSGAGAGPDLAWKATTIRTIPGQTADVMWSWTGEGLGWDIYGHSGGEVHQSGPGQGLAICGTYVPGNPATYFDPYNKEYCPDHGVPFPVILPPRDAVRYGAFYSGSPFLGGQGELPPGHAGLNAAGGFFYMWHSHTEKELTSNDIWPGGLVTFMIVEPEGVPIP